MKRFPLLLALLAGALLLALGASARTLLVPQKQISEQNEIVSLLNSQADAWNRGDIDAFMETYAQSEDLRFASGAKVTYGWIATLKRYKERYPTRDAMGKLAFHDIAVTELSPDAAVVFGHWELTRSGDHPHGLFTLIVRKSTIGWRIIHDHTSSA